VVELLEDLDHIIQIDVGHQGVLLLLLLVLERGVLGLLVRLAIGILAILGTLLLLFGFLGTVSRGTSGVALLLLLGSLPLLFLLL